MADVVARARRRRSRSGSDTPRADRAAAGGGAGANVAAWLARAGVACARRRASATTRWRAVALGGLRRASTLRVARDRRAADRHVRRARRPGGERTMLPDPGANDALRRRPAASCSRRATSCTSPATRCCAPARARRRSARSAARASAGCRSRSTRRRRRRCARRRVPAGGAPVDLLLPNEDELAVLGAAGRAGARGQARRATARVWTDGTRTRRAAASPPTWSTPPARATRSPPASSAPGRARRRRRWPRARGSPRWRCPPRRASVARTCFAGGAGLSRGMVAGSAKAGRGWRFAQLSVVRPVLWVICTHQAGRTTHSA